MITNDVTALKIKHGVLYEMAKLAWKGVLDGKKKDIPYKLIPDPQARFRRCIYQECGITRQRVGPAKSLCPTDGKDTTSIIQAIGAACEGCPVVRFMVTDNCQLCMGRAYQNPCNFDTIFMGRDRAYIDPGKCKECGRCAQVCPYNTIADLTKPCRKACPADVITIDESDLVEIDESKCIQRGVCVHECPFGAIGSKFFMVNVVNMTRAGKKVTTMVAPATKGQFGADITMASWKITFKKTGFADMMEVGLGGDLTAAAKATEWAETYRDGRKMTTSCRPASVNIIRQHFSMLLRNMSTTISPTCAVSRMLKGKGPGTVTVFIGSCIVRKSGALDLNTKDNADYVLTYSEIWTIMKAKNVSLEPEENMYQEGSVFGKRFGNGGGMTAAVLECLKETGENMDIKVARCNEATEYKKALTPLKASRLPEDFVEGMVHEGGCVDGSSEHKPEMEARKNWDIPIGQTDDRGVHANLKNLGATDAAVHRYQAEKGFGENMPRSSSFFR